MSNHSQNPLQGSALESCPKRIEADSVTCPKGKKCRLTCVLKTVIRRHRNTAAPFLHFGLSPEASNEKNQGHAFSPFSPPSFS
jgi:hypothetical protein